MKDKHGAWSKAQPAASRPREQRDGMLEKSGQGLGIRACVDASTFREFPKRRSDRATISTAGGVVILEPPAWLFGGSDRGAEPNGAWTVGLGWRSGTFSAVVMAYFL